MSEQDNKEVIQRGYAAFSTGDMETVMSLFDDDCEWVQPGQSAVLPVTTLSLLLSETRCRLTWTFPTDNSTDRNRPRTVPW